MTDRVSGGGHGLRASNLRASYGGEEALRGVSLDVRAGSVLAILGPSGSGKSTLVRTVAGLHPLDAGRVEIGGRDVTRDAPERRGVGLVPQDGALFPTKTVAANVAYGLRGIRTRRAGNDFRVQELLQTVGLADLGARMPHQLSGGQQQRVAVARALAHDPALVLLDEPFNALDAALREQVRTDVVAAIRRSGTAAILVTHDREEALSLADTVAVLRDGELVQVGPPRALHREPVDAWTAKFIADANLLRGERNGNDAVTVLGRARATGVSGAAVTVVVRPEQIRVTAHGPGASADRVSFRGAEVRVEFVLDSDGTRVLARLEGGAEVREGDRVHLRITDTVHAVPSDPAITSPRPAQI